MYSLHYLRTTKGEMTMGLFGSPNIDKLKAKHDIMGLIKALDDSDEYTRFKAVQALMDLKSSGQLSESEELALGLYKEKILEVINNISFGK